MDKEIDKLRSEFAGYVESLAPLFSSDRKATPDMHAIGHVVAAVGEATCEPGITVATATFLLTIARQTYDKLVEQLPKEMVN